MKLSVDVSESHDRVATPEGVFCSVAAFAPVTEYTVREGTLTAWVGSR